MDLLRKYLMPFYQAPDTPAPPAGELAAVLDGDPAPTEPLDDGATPPIPIPSAPRMVPEEIFLQQVAPLRARARDAETALDRANRQIAEQNELLARLSRKEGDPPPAPAAPHHEPATSADQDVETRAAQLVFMREAKNVSETGARKFGNKWVETVNVLEAFGINNGDFVSAVMDVDRIHTPEIMHAIAKDPQKAAALAAMTPNQRVSEITRISDAMAAKTDAPLDTPVAPKPAAPATKTVSRAPAPPPPLEPSASKIIDGYADEASDEDFTRQFNERMKQRAAQGRR